jgi:soluble lytic murein transglycosylase-like protein
VDPLPVQLCQRGATGESLRPFEILKAVHLDTLAEQDLKARLALEPSSVSLLLTLSRFASEQGQHRRALHNTKKVVPDYYSQPFSELPREIWDLLYPKAFERLVRHHAAMNRLDPYLVMAIIRQESAFNPRATSPSNARGLMQILPATVTRSRRYQRSVAQRLYSPTYNVRFGCDYLRRLLKQFNGNLPEALAAYNAGPTRVSQWVSDYSFQNPEEFVESIPFHETRIYVKGVLKDRAIYHQMMTGRAEFAECHTPSRAARGKSTAGLPGRSRRQARLLSRNTGPAALH